MNLFIAIHTPQRYIKINVSVLNLTLTGQGPAGFRKSDSSTRAGGRSSQESGLSGYHGDHDDDSGAERYRDDHGEGSRSHSKQ